MTQLAKDKLKLPVPEKGLLFKDIVHCCITSKPSIRPSCEKVIDMLNGIDSMSEAEIAERMSRLSHEHRMSRPSYPIGDESESPKQIHFEEKKSLVPVLYPSSMS